MADRIHGKDSSPDSEERKTSSFKSKIHRLYTAEEEKKGDSFLEKMADRIHGKDSSPDSEERKTSSFKSKIHRLFGREKPVHMVFGGGKPADVFLWRDKKVSAGVFVGATAVWVLFDVLEYHLLTFISHGLILALAVLFLWSNATTFVNKSPPRIPEVDIPEDPVLKLASTLRIEINRAIAFLRDVALGKDLKTFLCVIAGLLVLSFIGSCCDFLTQLYISIVLLLTVPVFYEKYEHEVDSFAEQVMAELKKQYAVFDAKVLSKIPRGPSKGKKRV